MKKVVEVVELAIVVTVGCILAAFLCYKTGCGRSDTKDETNKVE